MYNIPALQISLPPKLLRNLGATKSARVHALQLLAPRCGFAADAGRPASQASPGTGPEAKNLRPASAATQASTPAPELPQRPCAPNRAPTAFPSEDSRVAALLWDGPVRSHGPLGDAQ
eukprot:7141088-Pyramimonas_sp.AAC.1